MKENSLEAILFKLFETVLDKLPREMLYVLVQEKPGNDKKSYQCELSGVYTASRKRKIKNRKKILCRKS